MLWETQGLGIHLPSGWRLQDGGAVLTTNPAAPMSLVVEREPAGNNFSLPDYARDARASLEEDVPGYTLKEEGPVSVRGGEAWCRTHTFTVQTNRVEQVQVYFCDGAWVWSIALAFPPGRGANAADRLLDIVDALEVH